MISFKEKLLFQNYNIDFLYLIEPLMCVFINNVHFQRYQLGFVRFELLINIVMHYYKLVLNINFIPSVVKSIFYIVLKIKDILRREKVA